MTEIDILMGDVRALRERIATGSNALERIALTEGQAQVLGLHVKLCIADLHALLDRLEDLQGRRRAHPTLR